MAILDSTIINGDLSVNGNFPAPPFIADVSGGNATATGTQSCAFGTNSSAGDLGGVAFGYTAVAGETAVAIGRNAVASKNAVALGGNKFNNGKSTGGASTSANVDSAVAVGNGASTGTDNSAGSPVVIGSAANAGSGCVAVGSSAGSRNSNVYYSFCTCVGAGASATGASVTLIGYNARGPSSSTRLGCGSYTSSGRALLLGVAETGYTYMNAAGSSWTSASDIRDKTDIQEIEHSLDFIKKIHPITYVMNNREDYIIKDEANNPILDENGKQQYDVEAHERGDKKKHRRFAGVSAQETYQALIDCYKDDNYAQIVDDNKYDNPDDEYIQQYTVSYERFVPFLIKAIQEQQEQIETLQARLDELENLTQDNSSDENSSEE